MTTTTEEYYILQARLNDRDDQTWYDMGGFTYTTLQQLQDCYNKHFAHIEGKGCTYQFKHITITTTTETLTPTHNPKKN